MANPNLSTQQGQAPGAAIAAHQVVAMLIRSDTVKLNGFTQPALMSTPIWVPTVDLAEPKAWAAERTRVKRFLRWALVLGVLLAMLGLAAAGFVAGHLSASSAAVGGPAGAAPSKSASPTHIPQPGPQPKTEQTQ